METAAPAIDLTEDPQEDRRPALFEGARDDVWDELRRRAYRAQGDWARLALADGLLLAMRVRSADWRKEVYVARSERADPEAWRQEVRRLFPHLYRPGWHRDEGQPPEGVATRFIELWVGEIRPGVPDPNAPKRPRVIPRGMRRE